MSAQTMADVFAPLEADNRRIVQINMWGHLAPKRHRTYNGRVVYAVGCFGSDDLNPTVIVSDFKGLDSSPWFYDALHDFLDELSWKPEKEFPPRRGHGKRGCVYEWVGTFRNYEFDGSVRLMFDANQREAK